MSRTAGLLVAVWVLGFPTASHADPVVNFFKAIGRSMSHAKQKPAAAKPPRPRRGKTHAENNTPDPAPPPMTTGSPAASSLVNASPSATPASSPTAPPLTVARATVINPETHGSARDVPYAIPVPNKPGFVTSPYAPNQGLVDIRGFRSGTEVKDPYTGKFFLIP